MNQVCIIIFFTTITTTIIIIIICKVGVILWSPSHVSFPLCMQ
jgi:hypothetical protein